MTRLVIVAALVGLVAGFLLAHLFAFVGPQIANRWRAFVARNNEKFLRARGLYRAPWVKATRQYRRVMQREHVAGMGRAALAKFGRTHTRRERRDGVKAYTRALRNAAKQQTGSQP